MTSYDPKRHPQWAAVRAAIKDELVDRNMEYPGGWHGGWLSPGSDAMADAMLNGLADVAVEAAFALDKVVARTENMQPEEGRFDRIKRISDDALARLDRAAVLLPDEASNMIRGLPEHIRVAFASAILSGR